MIAISAISLSRRGVRKRPQGADKLQPWCFALRLLRRRELFQEQQWIVNCQDPFVKLEKEPLSNNTAVFVRYRKIPDKYISSMTAEHKFAGVL